MSTTVAEPVPGGYRVTGRKNFGSLGPVWDQIGFHAMDSSKHEAPIVVHGFARRTDPGVRIVENWDTIAMRASQSHDTVFESVFVPADRIVATHPAGDGDEPVTATAFFWGLLLISNVYVGIAERALELAVESLSTKTAIAMEGRTLAHNPMLQYQVADMWIALDGLSLPRSTCSPPNGAMTVSTTAPSGSRTLRRQAPHQRGRPLRSGQGDGGGRWQCDPQ